MSLLSRLFGGGSGGETLPAAVTVEHEGLRITPRPIAEDGQFRLAALIEADREGETLTHHLIRADVIRSREEAEQAAIRKAKQLIDQMGMGLFR